MMQPGLSYASARSSATTSIQTGSKRFFWEKDGANGTTDENNSITILIPWMTKEGNFAQFRGNKEGKTKLAICQEIAVLMAAENVKGDRTAKNILDKIRRSRESIQGRSRLGK
jgi:hypothetical protein